MGVAIAGSIAEVVGLVATYAPQLIADADSLTSLYEAASNAVAGAAPDGTVSAADWGALNATVMHLRADLDAEVKADAASQPPGGA